MLYYTQNFPHQNPLSKNNPIKLKIHTPIHQSITHPATSKTHTLPTPINIKFIHPTPVDCDGNYNHPSPQKLNFKFITTSLPPAAAAQQSPSVSLIARVYPGGFDRALGRERERGLRQKPSERALVYTRSGLLVPRADIKSTPEGEGINH